jgi:hypothetical protein
MGTPAQQHLSPFSDPQVGSDQFQRRKHSTNASSRGVVEDQIEDFPNNGLPPQQRYEGNHRNPRQPGISPNIKQIKNSRQQKNSGSLPPTFERGHSGKPQVSETATPKLVNQF